jgi:hypothetical protein
MKSEEQNRIHDVYVAGALFVLFSIGVGLTWDVYKEISNYEKSYFYEDALLQINLSRDAKLDSTRQYNKYIFRDSVLLNVNNRNILTLRTKIYNLEEEILIEQRRGHDISAQMKLYFEIHAELNTELEKQKEETNSLTLNTEIYYNGMPVDTILAIKNDSLKVLEDSLTIMENECYF